MIKLKNLFKISVIFLMCSAATAQQKIDLTDGLILRNQLDLVTQTIRRYIIDPIVAQRREAWLNESSISNYVSDCQFKLRPFIQSENIIGNLCYTLRQPQEKRAIALNFFERYYLEIAAALFEISNDPRYSVQDQKKAQQYFNVFWDLKNHKPQPLLDQAKSCFKPALNAKYENNGNYRFSPFQFVASCFHQVSEAGKIKLKLPVGEWFLMPGFALNLSREFSNHPGHAVTPTGWTSGNSVRYHTQNDTSVEMEKYLDSKYDLMSQHYPLNSRGSVQAFERVNSEEVFLESEGFEPIEKHPIWSQQSGIFHEILAGINEARETLFIDIFFLGGTMGAALSKHLIKKIKTNPNLKILILRDNLNHFGHNEEMLPIFNFLLAQSKKFPKQLVIAQSYIEGRTSGLPSFLQGIITDAFLTRTGLQGHLALYGRAQSDHSKVIVIDGLTSNAKAFVGSKNLTDSSGGICYDEVAEVKGPAAHLVQDDYYYDMKQALLLKMTELYPGYVEHLYQNGWAQRQAGQSPLSHNEMITEILKPFDLLNRNSKGEAQLSNPILVSSKGEAIIRTGYNNFDSTRTNAIDQNIQAILNAKSKILIKDQFLFDRNVVNALIRAKAKNRNLDIRIILEPLTVTQPAGLPNIIYFDDLKKAGIRVKLKNTRKTNRISQEYHMKTLSVDGEYLITGSANKDMNTMYGSFREEQLDIFDKPTTQVHDQDFERSWSSSTETSPEFVKHDFAIPGDLKGLNGEPLTPDRFVQVIRGFIGMLYDAKVY